MAAEIGLSKRFFKATEWAAAHHEARAGFGPATPSLGEVLGIASLVLVDGGSEREAIAAMVLDAVGDDEIPLREVRSRFGKKVARLVERAARERGIDVDELQTTLAHLADDGDSSVRRVLAADALRELRALVLDLRRSGSITFARYSVRPTVQLEQFQAKVGALTRDDPRGSLSEELRAVCAEVRRLVEVDTADAAWQVAHSDAA
jgi:(p)ppGpp synthase/HD superfamily hydrolase